MAAPSPSRRTGGNIATLTSNTPSTFNGTADSSIAVSPFLIPNGTFSATYTLANAADAAVGRFTATSTVPAVPFNLVIYAVGGGGLVSIEVTPSNTASAVTFYEQ